MITSRAELIEILKTRPVCERLERAGARMGDMYGTGAHGVELLADAILEGSTECALAQARADQEARRQERKRS